MKQSKTTRKALLTSVLAMVLCLAMLIGTTFAWFTDSASTGVNQVVSGTLDVVLEMKVGETWVDAQGETLEFVKAAGAPEGEAVLWEPGCTYELPELRIRNNGSLALKYKIEITGITGDAKLNEVITWTYKVGDATPADLSEEGHLKANETSGLITITGHMQETAGNEYQNLSIDGIGITVVATQDTVEFDSYNNTYDATAAYPAINADELKTALAAGGVVALANDVAVVPVGEGDGLVPQMTVTEDTTLNLQNQTLALDLSAISPSEELSYVPALISVEDGSTLTINGDGVVDAEADYNTCYGIVVTDGTLVINGGTYYGAMSAVQVVKGSLVINGGFFDLASTIKSAAPEYAKYLINCIDDNYNDGSATVSITGGTFVNFNPADNAAEGAGTNFVAEGYTVVSETKDNGDIWYTVVPKEPVAVNSVEEFKQNLENGNTLVLGSNLELTENLSVANNVTIEGNGTAKITGYPVYVGATNTVTFSGVNFADTTIPENASSVYGKKFQGTMIFEDCTFGDSNWESVQVTPAGDATIIFKNCTFAITKETHRFIHIEPDSSNNHQLNITIVNCTFKGCENMTVANYDHIDLDYIAQGSTLTLGGCTFLTSDGTAYTDARAYFCKPSSDNYARTYDYDAMYTMLTGDIQTYTVE